MHARHFTAVLAALVPAVAAQHISYPQETLQYRLGNLLPLGSGGGGAGSQVEEGRWHQLIPADHLPTRPGPIRGLSVVIGGLFGAEHAIPYASLRISLAHTNRTTLSTAFAQNLNSPVTVVDRTDTVLTWIEQRWNHLPFDTPFDYDGKSGLLIEFRKEVDARFRGSSSAANQPGNPGRPDLPAAVYSFGPAGSGAAGAANAAVIGAPLQLRLHVESPTLVLLSDPVPALFGHVFALAQSFDATVTAAAGSRYCTWVGAGFGPRFSWPGASGEGVVQPLAVISVGAIGGEGSATASVPIPADPNLVGGLLAVQAGVLGTNGQLSFTNAADFVINS